MRILLVLPFVLGLACTKHNPESCCSTQGQCDSFGLGSITPCNTGLVCDTSGACVMPECTTSADCTSAATPFCENQVCIAACSIDDECSAMAGKPFCGSAGECVACKDDSMCTTTAPVCDATANACRGCVKDSECPSNVCLESNGTCPDEANVIFVLDSGSDAGDCTSTAPCATLTYALTKMISPRTVIKILSTHFSVGSTTLQIAKTGYIDGSSTLLQGTGSNGIFSVVGGDLTLSSMTLDTDSGTSGGVTGGRLTLYDIDAKGTVSTDGATIEIDRSTLEADVTCGHSGTATASMFSANNSTFFKLETFDCTVLLEANTFSNFMGFNGALIATTGGMFAIQNNIVVSDNAFDDVLSLGGGPGSTFRFNTVVNLSGENDTANSIDCFDAGLDVSDNIIAWHTSIAPMCPTEYTLFDNIVALPPGAGNQIGDPSTFFVDMANKNFHLAPGSPAIGAAQPGVAIPTDFDGNPRPAPSGTNADVGAFESP